MLAVASLKVQTPMQGMRMDIPPCTWRRYSVQNQNEVVKVLLDAGADLEARTDFGETPLHVAVRLAVIRGTPEVVKMLLDAGANLEARSELGFTPLHLAVDWPETPAPR